MTVPFVLRSWPHDMTQRLKEMWWDGHSASFIAQTIGASSGKAVSEKAHRSGFIRNPEIEQMRAAHKIADHLVPKVRDDGSLITIANVKPPECRYMFGDEPSVDAPMCGRPIAKRSLCEAHLARAYHKGTA
jgi:hypothetical protein